MTIDDFEGQLVGGAVSMLIDAGGKLRVERGELVDADQYGLRVRMPDGREVFFYRRILVAIGKEPAPAGGPDLDIWGDL